MLRQTMILAAGLAVLAGCGGGGAQTPSAAGSGPHGERSTSSGSGGGPGLTASASGKSYDQAVKLSECMRAHGVPNFPDPTRTGNSVRLTLRAGNGLDPNSARFKAAQQACRRFAPPGAQNGTVPPKVRQQALAFAQCMRTHGVPNFPDPQFSGGGVQVGGANLNASSPQFKAAQQACQPKLPGAGG
jgi:hypothetical protein